jgi:carboxymethylenebutenolidase
MTQDVTATTTTVPTADGPMRLHDALPAAPATAGVVVIHQAFGVDPYIEGVCRDLAGAGFRAVAPHLFHRTGDPALAYDDIDTVLAHVGRLTRAGLEADVDAALGHLVGTGLELSQLGVLGFGNMGGTTPFLTAIRRPIGAAVTFYGAGIVEGRFGFSVPALVELAADLQAPWLGLYADDDHGISPDRVEALRAAAARAAVPTEVVRYAGVGHEFHCPARPSYDASAAADAWARARRWLETYLVTSPG